MRVSTIDLSKIPYTDNKIIIKTLLIMDGFLQFFKNIQNRCVNKIGRLLHAPSAGGKHGVSIGGGNRVHHKQ